MSKILQRLITVILVVTLVTGTLGSATNVVFAQSEETATTDPLAELPDPLTPEAIRELVSRLSDQEVRNLLLSQLDANAQNNTEDEASTSSSLEVISGILTGIVGGFAVATERIPVMIESLGKAASNFSDGRGWSGFLWFLVLLAACIAIGLAATKLVARLTHQWRNTDVVASSDSLAESVRILVTRAFKDTLGIIVFGFASYYATLWLFPRPTDQAFAWLFIFCFFIIMQMNVALSRFTVAPTRPDLRPLSVDDYYAKKMHNYMYLFGFLIGLLQFGPSAAALFGIPPGEMRLGFWLNLILYIAAIYAFYDCRNGIIQIVIGHDNLMGETGLKIARWWPNIAIVLMILNWMLIEALAAAGRFDLLQGQQHATMMLIVMAPALDTALRGIVKHMTPPMIGEGAVAERAHKATLASYLRIGRVVLLVLEILLVSAIWQFNLLDLANQNVGAQLAKALIGSFSVLLIGYVVWELVNLWINRRLAKEMTDAGIDLDSDEPGGGEGGGTGVSRLATVLPVIHLVANGVILIITPLLALGQLGLNITPLLAGAGIVGLAVGFGAQTLVRDVVSGIFFLIEDAFRVGEYLVVGDTVGTVEKISLRSLQLRHHEGPVHTIPYGEIPQVTNNSRDWVIMKLKFTFPFDTDANKIKKIFKKIGAEMLEADYAEDLIQTFKSQGVYDVDDVGVVIRGKFMTKPGKQWIIRKDIYNRVQKALDEAGIEFARKEVRVSIPGLDETPQLSDDQKKQIGAAAADAAEKEVVQKA